MPRRLGAIAAVACAVALSVLNGAIANVALPTIGTELDVTPAASIWIVNAYQLAIVVSLLTFAALGEVWSYRKVYLSGVVVFTLASACCAASHSFGMLVAARVVQGFGAAAITGINTTLIRLIYPRSQLGRGLGINATVVAVSSVVGPSIAAAILSVAQWPWLFAVSLPVGCAALLLGFRYLPGNPRTAVQRHLHWGDAAMNALTFGLLMASVEGFSHRIDPRLSAAGIAALIIVGTLFVRSQLRRRYPLLPLDLLRIPIFAESMLTSICSYTGQMLALVALPFYLQHELGHDPVAIGLLLTAWPAAVVVTAPIAGLLVERIHAGGLGAAGLALMAVGLLLTATLPEAPAPREIVWRLMLCGAGFGLFQSPNNSLLIASSPPERSGSASGMLGTARLIGQTTGAALMALLFRLLPDASTRTALFTAGAFAAAGAIVGLSRLSQPLPEGLRRDKKSD